MFAFSARLEMDHPASVVWRYLLAFEQVPLWEHGVVEVRQLTPGAANIGTEISARRIYAGRETRLSGWIVAYAEGRSATISLRGGPHDEAPRRVRRRADRCSEVRRHLYRPRNACLAAPVPAPDPARHRTPGSQEEPPEPEAAHRCRHPASIVREAARSEGLIRRFRTS